MMSKIVEDYYKQTNLLPFVLKQKMNSLKRHPDILGEFEYWIQNRYYKTEKCVVVEGYDAQKISSLSKYLDGEGVFMLLIELRENPKKAKSRIEAGFVLK